MISRAARAIRKLELSLTFRQMSDSAIRDTVQDFGRLVQAGWLVFNGAFSMGVSDVSFMDRRPTDNTST